MISHYHKILSIILTILTILYKAVLPVLQPVLVGCPGQGEAPLDTHESPDPGYQIVVGYGEHLLPLGNVSVEVVETGGSSSCEGEQPQVPGGGQTVPGVPTLQSEVPERGEQVSHNSRLNITDTDTDLYKR